MYLMLNTDFGKMKIIHITSIVIEKTVPEIGTIFEGIQIFKKELISTHCFNILYFQNIFF